MPENSMKEAVRMLDAERSLEEYAKIKCKQNAKFADAEPRRALNSKDIVVSMIKCMRSFNHSRVRSALINNELIGVKYLQYNQFQM